MTQDKTAASTDFVNGLVTRDVFMDRARCTFDKNYVSKQPASLLLFDLDRLKAINANFGHTTGDSVLCIFADRLTRTLTLKDVAARIDGGEFVAVLTGCGVDVAMAMAEQVRVAFKDDAYVVDGQTVCATVSVGVATVEGLAHSLAAVLARADGALVLAKASGGNKVAVAESGPCGASMKPAGSDVDPTDRSGTSQ